MGKSKSFEKRKWLLRTLSLLFMFGGIIRLFANEKLFSLFWMQDLWSDHPYFLYIYRVLGAFVILTGLFIFGISKNIEGHAALIPFVKWGFLVIGCTMLATGYFVGLHWLFYVFDFIFCFGLAGYFHFIENKINSNS
jgi:hypothetical protein